MSDEPAIAQESKLTYDWDFFIAHAGADLPAAEGLKQTLDPPAKAFLDAANILPGDTWSKVLSDALRSSLIHVVLVSRNTENAYYEGEEITVALQMVRQDPHTRRVVPVYLNVERVPADAPYGLNSKHGLCVPDPNDFSEIGQSLLKTLQVMKHAEGKKLQAVTRQQGAITKITSGGKADLVAGLGEATTFVRPLLKTLQIMLVVLVVLLVACLFSLAPLAHDERMLAITVLGCLCAGLLLAILGLIITSLSYSKQIALGRINGG